MRHSNLNKALPKKNILIQGLDQHIRVINNHVIGLRDMYDKFLKEIQELD